MIAVLLGNHWAVVVAMILMAVMKLPFIEVIDMVTMRNRFMSAFLVTTITCCGITLCRVLCAYGDSVLIVVAVVR
jgi:hypothetical protein